MTIVLDSNFLLRWIQQGHPQQKLAETAMADLEAAGYDLCLLPQNLYEFWVVSTRPTNVNGLGKSGPETTRYSNNSALHIPFSATFQQFSTNGKA
jgi:predicted nucleic acid-binding protein